MEAETKDITKYDKGFLENLLQKMLLIRRFEEKAAQMYGLRKIGGFCHIYIGQEAVCTGAIAAADLTKDHIITAYRDHGHALSVGMEPKIIMAELFGKVTGSSRGKGGSMHLFDVGKHFYGGHGIVGAHIPLATGMAMKFRYCDQDGVTLCFFGDGAIHQGSFHESLNMAGLWKLPIVYICENNQYGMGTDFRRVSAVKDFSKLAASYKMPGLQVDGMDVLAVYENVKNSVELARTHSKPSLLEIRTYRYLGHSMSDPATYRTKEELAKHKSQDPITLLKDRMSTAGMLSENEYATMDANCRSIVADAIDFAEQSPEPDIETLYEDVLTESEE